MQCMIYIYIHTYIHTHTYIYILAVNTDIIVARAANKEVVTFTVLHSVTT